MKSIQDTLRIGQKVQGKIENVPDEDHVVVNCLGYFISVHNASSQKLKTGDKVELLVDSLRPLRFRLVRPQQQGFAINI